MKKSGITCNETSILKRQCASFILRTFITAANMFWSYTRINEELEKLYQGSDYKKLPRYAKEYLKGYMHAAMNAFVETHTEWRMFLDGRLVSKEELTIIAHNERNPFKGTHAIMPSAHVRVDNSKSCNTYKGRPDKLF